MLYLQDERYDDMIFNLLGVLSRMNIRQIFECLLRVSEGLLDRYYRIAYFDEKNEQKASKKLVFESYYECIKYYN